MQPTYRIYYFDYLKVLAFFSVVLIHNTMPISPFALKFNPSLLSDYFTSFAIYKMTLFAVPCFFIMSGAMLLNPSKSFNLLKTLKRLYPPLIFWIVVSFIALQFIFNTDVNLKKTLFLSLFISKQGWAVHHLWYIYTLIGFVLIVPFLRKIVATATKKDYIYLVSLFLVFIGLVDFINYFHLIHKFKINFAPPLITKYSIYFILGYYLTTLNFKSSYNKWFLLVIVTTTLLLIITGFEYASSTKRLIILEFIISIAVFLFFKTCSIFNQPNKLISYMAKLSFLTYLIHTLVQKTIFYFFRSYQNTLEAIAFALAIFVICFVIAFILDKLTPCKLKFIVGL